ncbi:hypothetical protein [Xylella fastidiosa]|uniref:Uncharacterized protein n=1 Tax=Xylella fastidiosa subsp. fastidiosa TaxID=644356 RepID=A0AAJ5QZ45_XYLFS|nr:hypothetical protein [Xylella fastidiosa]WCF27620.1 hypothetical protein OK117_08200 [Xylella fastidiosa subsp. fastidiosa]
MEMELKQTPRRHTQATALLFTTAPCVVAAAWPIPALPHHPCYSNVQRCPLPQRITASNQRFEECLDHSEGIYLVCLLTERHHGVC